MPQFRHERIEIPQKNWTILKVLPAWFYFKLILIFLNSLILKEIFYFIIAHIKLTKSSLSPHAITCLPSSYLSMLGTDQGQEGCEGAGVGPQAHMHKLSSLEHDIFESTE